MPDEARSWLLRVLSGPHRGAELPLLPGTYAVGSGEDDAIILADPDVATRHATLIVTPDGVRCVPEGGPVRLERSEVPAVGVPLRRFQPFGLGETFLAIGPKDEPWPEIALPDPRPSPTAAPAQARPDPTASVIAAGTGPTALTTAPGAAPGPATAPDGATAAQSRRPSVGLVLLLLLLGLLNAAMIGSLAWSRWSGGPNTDAASMDLVARVTDRIRGFSQLALLTEGGQRFRVDGTLLSEARREALLNQLRSLGIPIVTREGAPVFRVDGLLSLQKTEEGLIETLERVAELDVENADGNLSITGVMLASPERATLIDSFKRLPDLRVRPHSQVGYLEIVGSIDRSELLDVQKRLWRLGLTTVLAKTDGRIRVEGYCRTREARMERERSLAELVPPHSARVSWIFRNMEDLVTAARNTRTEKGLERVQVEEGGLGQILLDPPDEPITPEAWDALVGALESDPRILSVLATGRPVSPAAIATADRRPIEKPDERLTQPSPVAPAPKPPAALLPPIRSLHLGETQSITLRDGRRLFLGAPLGNGFRLVSITSDRVVLRDEDGHREEIRVADDVVGENDDTGTPSGDRP